MRKRRGKRVWIELFVSREEKSDVRDFEINFLERINFMRQRQCMYMCF